MPDSSSDLRISTCKTGRKFLAVGWNTATGTHLLSQKMASRYLMIQNGEGLNMYASILHQQSVYDATACAIPFLVQVASNTSAKNRAKIIEFLQDIENDTRTNPATSSCSGDH